MGPRALTFLLGCLLFSAWAPGCRAQLRGRVRMPDGSVVVRRLDPEQSNVVRRATVDLPCATDDVIVERVAGTTQFMVSGCGREAAYVCARLPRIGVLCDLEYVRAQAGGGERASPTGPIAAEMRAPAIAPPQAIVAIDAAAPAPSPDEAAPESSPPAATGDGRARRELGDPRSSP